NYFKVYLTNPSIYAAIFGLVNDDSEEIGSIVETAVFSQHMHASSTFDRIYYARWKNGDGEVDMVHLNQNLSVKLAMEVKWSDRYYERPEELTHLAKFAKACKLQSAQVTS